MTIRVAIIGVVAAAGLFAQSWAVPGKTGGTGGTTTITNSPGGSVTGAINYKDGAGFGADSAFFWDKTNHLLGIGTATPAWAIDVQETGNAVIRVWNKDDSTAAGGYVLFNSGVNTVDTTLPAQQYTVAVGNKGQGGLYKGAWFIKDETAGKDRFTIGGGTEAGKVGIGGDANGAVDPFAPDNVVNWVTYGVVADKGGLYLMSPKQDDSCDVDHQWLLRTVHGGSGVADTVQGCLKTSSNTYAWATIYPQAGGGSSFYQTVQVNGSAQTQRAKVNFTGTGITVADNGTDLTTITFPTSGGGSLNIVSSLPGTCTQGAQYFLTSGNPNAQIYTCSATNTLVQNGLLGGSGGLSRDASTGALDIVPSVIPTLSGTNTFSGLVEAADLKSTAGSSAPHACSVTADIGHFWTDTTDAANTHLKQCAATSSSIGWKTVY